MGADAFAWPASGVGEHTGRVLLQTTHAPVLRAIIQSSSGRAVHVTPGARLPAGQRARSPSGRSFSPAWPWPVLSQLVLLTHTPICGDAALKCSTVATWWAVAYALANAPLPKSSARWSCRRAFVHYYCCETCTVGLLMGNWTTF